MVNSMENKSLWLDGVLNSKVKKLRKNINVDVLIIGGGMTGLATAYYLRNSKLKVCLAEQNEVGTGVSSKTTGKINYLQETVYGELTKRYSFRVAEEYYNSQKYAIRELKRIILNEKIKCDLERVSSYVFTDDLEEVENLKFEKRILEQIGVNVFEHNIIQDFKCKYALSVDDTFVFHPVKFMYALKEIIKNKGIKVYEKTKICKVIKKNGYYNCLTKNGQIRAKKVIFACHYPFFLFPYLIPFKVYNEKSYVTASLTDKYEKETFITSTLPCKSVRYHRDGDIYKIYLSNSHNICDNLNTKANMEKTILEARKLNLEPKFIWINDDMMTVDKMPYIGRIKKDNDNLLIGTGYNTWGMTNSILAGRILSDIIFGKKNDYERLFFPLRVNFINYFDEYLENIGSSVKGFTCNKIIKNKCWYPRNVRFEMRNGKNVAIYNDGEKEHIVLSNCPHMGCTLIFNDLEKTWDCPCHASRFDIDGKCIKGPSCYDISFNSEDEVEEEL